MTGPIDPELLEPVLSAGPHGRSLPAVAYTSTDVLRWELRAFFADGWVCLGRADDAASPGDQRAFRIGDEGILVVRGGDGLDRGFFNTCRHRGHELLEPGGRRSLRAIKCPYHAWVYRLDGTLGAAPRFGDGTSFRKEDYPLIEARIGSWGGWLFVNAGGDAPWEPGRLIVGASRTDEVAANWKTIAEHHHRRADRRSGPLEGSAEGTYVGLFPNLLIGLHPDHVMTRRLAPIEPGLTRVECEWLLPPETSGWDGSSLADAVERLDVTNREDWRACESVQRGMTSAGPPPGPPTGAEDEVRAFVAMVARGYLDGRISSPPRVGSADRSPA